MSKPRFPQRRGRLIGPRLAAAALLLPCVLATGCGGFAARGLNAGGVRKFEQARYQEAIQDFQQAIYNDPNNADGYYNLAAAYHRLASLQKQKSDYDQAESYYNQCLDHNGDHAECYRGLAVLLAEQGRTEQAFRLIEGWVDRRGDLAEPRIELARLLEETGRADAGQGAPRRGPEARSEQLPGVGGLGQSPRDDRRTCPGAGRLSALALHNRFQPEVAARVAALQAVVPPSSSAGLSSGAAQTAAGGTGTLR